MKLFSLFAFASAASGTIFRTRDQIQDSFVQIPDNFDGEFENWNVTSLINDNQNDELFQEFENIYYQMEHDMGRQEFTEDERKMIKKFKLMKHMILYIQSLPLFGKFCFYGCHCFSNGPKELLIGAGSGKPLDGADNACRSHGRCHHCAKKDMNNCEVTKGYAFNAREDSVTQVRYIECLNELGSCKRSLCECDKALAYDLADMESEWNILHHQRWGQFDQQLNCKVHTATRDGALRIEKISEAEEECCGEFPRRFPFHANDGFGKIRRCCNGKTYDPNILECCSSGKSKPIGTCDDF